MFFIPTAVKIAQVSTDVIGTNAELVEGSRYNRILFTLSAATTPDSGSVSGERLWDLSIYGSQNPTGDGTKYGEQSLYNFNRYQEGRNVIGGEVINYGFVDTNLDMTGVVCNEVNFVCVTLRKHYNPDADFELIAIPDKRVLTDCFRVKCNGKITFLSIMHKY